MSALESRYSSTAGPKWVRGLCKCVVKASVSTFATVSPSNQSIYSYCLKSYDQIDLLLYQKPTLWH